MLLNIRDTPLDANTPSPYELMFHRRVKSDLPSIPLSLFDSTNSINAGDRSVKHAERTMKAKTEVNHQGWSNTKQSCLWRNLRQRRPDSQVGWSFQWTDNDHRPWKTTQPEHNIPETGSISSQSLDMTPLYLLQKLPRREEGASVPVEMPDTKVTANTPKPRPETPIQQKLDNPTDSVRTSWPRRIIKAPAKYGYE